MKACLLRLLRDEGGATMVEYGLVAAIIAAPLLIFMTIITLACGSVLTTAASGVAALATNP